MQMPMPMPMPMPIQDSDSDKIQKMDTLIQTMSLQIKQLQQEVGSLKMAKNRRDSTLLVKKEISIPTVVFELWITQFIIKESDLNEVFQLIRGSNSKNLLK